ncbi:MAG: DoxX family membrane protein [Syntrophales bacterium]|nr:DoxX family membrane protein [Syntrophales bacterium]
MVHNYSDITSFFKSLQRFIRKGASHPRIYLIVRLALAGLFIYGGTTKLFDPKAFAAIISSYDVVPEQFLPVFAIGLPLIETIAGLALLFDRSWGLHLITGLLVMFVFVLGYGILGDLDVDCGCFGAEDLNKQAGLRSAFYRDLVLIGLVVPYLYISRRVRVAAGNRDGR